MSIFKFKHFYISQARSALKVGTDAMILGALIQSKNTRRALDIGAGTGVLSLMLAQKDPNVEIKALEIDEQSFIDCRENFENSPWKERLEVQCADFLNYEQSESEMYDLIISNPPFYSKSLVNPNQRKAQTKHAEFLPVDELYSRVDRLLTEEGTFWLIAPFEHLDFHREIAGQNQLYGNDIWIIFGKPENPKRFVARFTRIEDNTKFHELLIRNTDGSYSKQYIELTAEFHGTSLA